MKPLAIAFVALMAFGLSATTLAFDISSGSPGRSKPQQSGAGVRVYPPPMPYAYPYSSPYQPQSPPAVERRQGGAPPGTGAKPPRISQDALARRRELEMRRRQAFFRRQIETRRNALYEYYFGQRGRSPSPWPGANATGPPE